MKGKLLTLLALALLVIPAASPYFLPGVPRTNDLWPHLMRAFFWGEAAAYTGLWPRWSAELVYGYGYPVFNFFPSLFHALLQGVHQIGLPLLTAYRVVTYLHFLLAAVSSYALGKGVFGGRLAGWAAAVVYVYSPYLLYDAHVRGSAPETQALALLPLLILAIWKSSETDFQRGDAETQRGWWRAVRQSLISSLQSPKWIVVTAVLFALTFLSHPIAYQLLIPIGVWLLLKAGFAAPSKGFWTTLSGPALGLGLGGLLVAFYWLPALAEVGFTRADTSISQGYAYQTNFLSLFDMLRFPTIPADPALINPPVVRAIPVVGLLWAVVVILWRWRRSSRLQREIAAAWTAVLVLSIWLITPSSQFVWDYFPLLRLTFYPWRLLSMTALATAVLAALSMRLIEERKIEDQRTCPERVEGLKIGDPTALQSSIFNLFPSLLLTSLILISSIPWLYPPRQSMPETIGMARALQEELPPFFIGTTTLGEFLPGQVAELPDYLPEDAALRAGNNPDRLQAADGLSWTRLDENPIDARYEVLAERPLTAVYRQFNFPGWRVRVDGQAVDIIPSDPHGLITFPVPAGEHEVRVTFGNTGARWLGWVISALAFAALLALANIARRVHHAPPATRHPSPAAPSSTANPQSLILLGITAVLFWLLFSFIDTPLRQPTLQADGIAGKPAVTPLDFAGEVRLLSYETPPEPVVADSAIPLNLYFQAQREIGVPYHIGVQVVDENGLNWMADNTRPFDWRYIAEEPWPPDAYRLEPFLISLLDGTPPGSYRFLVGLVRADTGQTVAAHQLGELLVAEAAQGDRALEDGMNAVQSASTGSASASTGSASASTGSAYADNLQLLGARLDRGEAAPGDPVRVTALWQAQAPNAANQFTLQLAAADGAIMLSQIVPIAPDYPADQWQSGDRLRTETVLRLPAATPDGAHTWQIMWGNEIVEAGTVQVTAPERRFKEACVETACTELVETAVNQTVGDIATLLGFSTNPNDNTVTLVWQAQNETPISYRVFVHLLGPDDEIISQSDGEPLNWSRPTTGWLPGEILQDTHSLTFPTDSSEGALSLRVGLYDPETGQRLPTETGDSITIPLP